MEGGGTDAKIDKSKTINSMEENSKRVKQKKKNLPSEAILRLTFKWANLPSILRARLAHLNVEHNNCLFVK
jgi:hypothetical protein